MDFLKAAYRCILLLNPFCQSFVLNGKLSSFTSVVTVDMSWLTFSMLFLHCSDSVFPFCLICCPDSWLLSISYCGCGLRFLF